MSRPTIRTTYTDRNDIFPRCQHTDTRTKEEWHKAMEEAGYPQRHITSIYGERQLTIIDMLRSGPMKLEWIAHDLKTTESKVLNSMDKLIKRGIIFKKDNRYVLK